MAQKKLEFYVGSFLLLGVICATWLFTALGGVDINKNDDYSIYAYFTSVSGLKKGASIEMAGVQVGNVVSITLDTTRYLAKVELSLNRDLQLTDDAIASVKTAGIIGDKFVNLSQGGSDDLLAQGDTIYNTESSLDIESLVSKYIFQSNKK